MTYEEMLEQYKDIQFVKNNKKDYRAILQYMKTEDPVLFKILVDEQLRAIDNYMIPYSDLGAILGIAKSSARDRISNAGRRFVSEENRNNIRISLPDTLMEKLLLAGYRYTRDIMHDVLYGKYIPGVTEDEHSELCIILSDLTGLASSRFAPYISEEEYVDAGCNSDKVIITKNGGTLYNGAIPRLMTRAVDNLKLAGLSKEYSSTKSVVLGITSGLYAHDLSKSSYEDISNAISILYNLNPRRVVPYIDNRVCKECAERNWEFSSTSYRVKVAETIGAEFMYIGSFIALSDFVRERFDSEIVSENAFDSRVWLQAAKENSPRIWEAMLSRTPELDGIDNMLSDSLTIDCNDCKRELVKLIMMY